MSPTEQRIAIAEACGYQFRDESTRYPQDANWCRYKAVYSDGGFIGLAKPDWIPVPDYLTDLNAIAAAESTLTDEERISYAKHLSDNPAFCRLVVKNVRTQLHLIISATAAQRADAFLRAKGLIKNSSP